MDCSWKSKDSRPANAPKRKILVLVLRKIKFSTYKKTDGEINVSNEIREKVNNIAAALETDREIDDFFEE